MFRRCPKAFYNNCNCIINQIGVIYSQYSFGGTLSKKSASYRNQPTNFQFKSTDWFLYDTSSHQKCLHTGPS